MWGKNYKTDKKSKKNQINGAIFHVHGYEDSLSRYRAQSLIDIFTTVLVKIQVSLFYGHQQTDFEVYIERQKMKKSQHNIEGEK